jgi:hypothetical protein
MARRATTRGFAVALAALVLLTGAVERAHAAPGSLDPAFGQGGVAEAHPPREGTVFVNHEPVAVDRLGRIYLNGSMRLLPNGSPDASFGENGIRALPAGVNPGLVQIAPSGRLVAAGVAFETEEEGSYFIWLGGELSSDAGRMIPMGTAHSDGYEDLAVAPNGSIAFLRSYPGPARVIMLTASGAPDKRFGHGGLRVYRSFGNQR